MTNIFIGNLSFKATPAELQAIFEHYGSVERVNIVTDRESGQPRGFAFVEMTDRGDAEMAIAHLHGAKFNDRAITVTEARSSGAAV